MNRNFTFFGTFSNIWDDNKNIHPAISLHINLNGISEINWYCHREYLIHHSLIPYDDGFLKISKKALRVNNCNFVYANGKHLSIDWNESFIGYGSYFFLLQKILVMSRLSGGQKNVRYIKMHDKSYGIKNLRKEIIYKQIFYISKYLYTHITIFSINWQVKLHLLFIIYSYIHLKLWRWNLSFLLFLLGEWHGKLQYILMSAVMMRGITKSYCNL